MPPRPPKTQQVEFPWAFPAPKRNPPVHVARTGNVRVPVYRYADGRHCVAWRQVDGAKLKRETFPTKAAAMQRADEIALAVANSLADVVTLTSADRDNYRLAAQALAPLGIPLHAAISEYVSAKEKLGGHTLMEATNFFVRGHVDRLACPASVKILEELIAGLEDDRRGDKYVPALRRDLQRFVTAFPDLNAATEQAVRDYLRGLRVGYGLRKGDLVSARRRDNVRDGIVRLARFARERGYLPADKVSPTERIKRIAVGVEVTTYTPAQVADCLAWFAEHARDWLPLVAISAFAGIRVSEIYRLDWSAFKWATASISIPRPVARKVRISRKVPILPPLAAWLEAWRESTGPIFPDVLGRGRPRKRSAVESARRRVWARFKRATGMLWQQNALRHSFGSHRLAIVKSEEQVALEMGNSPAQVREHYNDPKDESEAVAYFGILPPAHLTEKVVPFSRAKSVT